jgi:Spy/CpxP family protein refolding chaperone
MKCGWRSAMVALVATVALTSTAFAQRGGGRGGFGFGGRGGGLAMLRMPEVQTELKLTDDQKTKVSALSEKIQAERRNSGQNFRDLSDEERQKMMAERRASEDKQLGEILNADQMKRYHQLQLQQTGMMAVTQKEVADQLNLTADQKTKIQEIVAAQQAEMRSAFQGGGGGGDRSAMREKMMAMRKQTDDKIAAVLTDDQKNKWKELVGAPFTFPTGGPPAARAGAA